MTISEKEKAAKKRNRKEVDKRIISDIMYSYIKYNLKG